MCQEAANHWYKTYTEAARLVNFTRLIFKFDINQGFCRDNPMDKIMRPKNEHKKDYDAPFYDKDELQKFLQAVKENESLKNYTVFHVLAFTGLRRAELFGLQWKDIDFKRKTLSVKRNLIYNEATKNHEYTTPKTSSSIREIGIDSVTIRALLEWRNFQREFLLGRGVNANAPNQLVFTSHNNFYMTGSFLREIIKRITVRYDLPHITLHGLRHTHCSLLFDAGIHVKDVKERLGHSDIKTTLNIYTHVTKSQRKKTADVFEDFMQNDFLEK